MKTIWKYQLSHLAYQFTIEMPEGAKPLCVQMQRDEATMWALVETGAPMVKREFVICGTGRLLSGDSLVYIGTYQQMGGALVWHVFEVVQ